MLILSVEFFKILSAFESAYGSTSNILLLALETIFSKYEIESNMSPLTIIFSFL